MINGDSTTSATGTPDTKAPGEAASPPNAGVSNAPRCWICGAQGLQLYRRGSLSEQLTVGRLRITDADYGTTADIYQCARCGFLECPNVEDVLSLYEEMDDVDYEATRNERALQARGLLSKIAAHKPSGRLLDVGAGSGILVEEASRFGFSAVGVEPSRPLQARAAARSLPVVQGALPLAELEGPFDVVTLIDVIEHVTDPVGLLLNSVDVLAPDGVCVIVTPDVASFAARLMGRRWWHYRVAHIGYFNRQTLDLAVSRAGLRVVATCRPNWYFPAGYLANRAFSFLPRRLRPPVPDFLDKIVVPLNLFDSLLVICTLDRSARNPA